MIKASADLGLAPAAPSSSAARKSAAAEGDAPKFADAVAAANERADEAGEERAMARMKRGVDTDAPREKAEAAPVEDQPEFTAEDGEADTLLQDRTIDNSAATGLQRMIETLLGGKAKQTDEGTVAERDGESDAEGGDPIVAVAPAPVLSKDLSLISGTAEFAGSAGNVMAGRIGKDAAEGQIARRVSMAKDGAAPGMQMAADLPLDEASMAGGDAPDVAPSSPAGKRADVTLGLGQAANMAQASRLLDEAANSAGDARSAAPMNASAEPDAEQAGAPIAKEASAGPAAAASASAVADRLQSAMRLQAFGSDEEQLAAAMSAKREEAQSVVKTPSGQNQNAATTLSGVSAPTSSASQASQATNAPAGIAGQTFQTLAAEIERMAPGGKLRGGADRSLTMTLQPAHLGRVEIRLRADNGSIRVELRAEQAHANSQLSDQSVEMRRKLEDGSGLQVDIRVGDVAERRAETASAIFDRDAASRNDQPARQANGQNAQGGQGEGGSQNPDRQQGAGRAFATQTDGRATGEAVNTTIGKAARSGEGAGYI